MRVWIGLVLLTGLLFGPGALAQQRTDLQDEVRRIAAQLRCPVCQNLSVADSPSELAQQMRGVIREQLEAGRTPEEIRAYFVSKYGEWVLLSPKPRGLNLLIYVGPFLAVAAGVGWAIRVIRRWTHQSRQRERPAVDPALLARVRQEAAREDLSEPREGSPLVQKRSRLYGALRELEFDYRSRKLSAEDYEATRANYEAEAARVLASLDALRARPQRAPRAQTAAPAAPRMRTSRRWRVALGTAFVLVFGIALGIFLGQSVRPRLSDQDSITGDFLTGTGPAGVAPGSATARMPAVGPGSDLATLLQVGEEAYHRGEWRRAIEAFKQALAKDPGNPVALTHIGMTLTEGGHFDQALAAFDQALVRHPGYFPALFVKGIVLSEGKQDYAGALKTWEQIAAADLPPTDADRLRGLISEARRKLSGGATD
ncbi:MAG: cytochrome c-type biogenesis protein CcmH [Candidatus Methylomirabilia bacterium]